MDEQEQSDLMWDRAKDRYAETGEDPHGWFTPRCNKGDTDD